MSHATNAKAAVSNADRSASQSCSLIAFGSRKRVAQMNPASSAIEHRVSNINYPGILDTIRASAASAVSDQSSLRKLFSCSVALRDPDLLEFPLVTNVESRWTPEPAHTTSLIDEICGCIAREEPCRNNRPYVLTAACPWIPVS